FAIKQKMTAAILLFTVIGLVMLTNMREQRIAARISTAVTSIYEDRLVVAQYILKLSKEIESIIATLEKGDAGNTTVLAQRLSAVAGLNVLEECTRLTASERTNFEAFKQLCPTIAQNDNADNRRAAVRAAREAAERLQILSAIQGEEGKNLLGEVLSMTYFSNI